MPLRIIIAEDHPLFLAGLKNVLLQDDTIQIVAEAKNGEEVLQHAKIHSPDIIVMDISMPKMDGIDATKAILAFNPAIKVLALSIHSGKRFVKGMLEVGVSGYVLKDAAPDELLTAIESVQKGKMYLSPGITSVALDSNTENTHKTDFPVLRTKLYRPKLNDEFILRSHIIDRLEQNIDKPLSLISAGAGYGKSITISQWLSTTKALHAWISLDEEHNDVRMFLTYIKTAIDTMFSGKLTKIGNMVSGGSLPALDLITNTLINELDEISTAFILVLDDFHRIGNEDVLHIFNELIKFPPEHLHLCISTRRDPALSINKLRFQDRIVEIRMTDLAFSEEEMVKLAPQFGHADLKEDLISVLHQKTEGWIVGICLSLLSLDKDNKPDKILRSIEKTSYSTSDFLIEEVLSKQETWMKELLIYSSVLNRFSPELIQQFIKKYMGTDSEDKTGLRFIQGLYKANLFVISLDHKQEWFRYHHLFQELLQNQLKAHVSKVQIAELHILAANWFEENKHIEEAIFHMVEAREMERAALIIERNREEAVNTDKWYVLEKWLDQLPETIIQSRPGLLMAHSWVLLHHFKFAEVFEKMAIIEQLCGDDEKYDAIMGEVALMKGYILYFMGDGASSLQLMNIALAKIPLSYYEARAQTEVINTLSLQMTGQKEVAVQFLDDLFTHPKPTNNVRQSRLFVTYVMLHYVSANFKLAQKYNKQLFKVVHKRMAYAEAWNHFLDGLMYLHQYKLEDAITSLEKSVSQRYIHFKRAATDSIIALMIAHQVNGDAQKVSESLHVLREFILPLHDPAYDLLLKTAEMRLALMQDHLEHAKQLMIGLDLPPNEPAMLWWIEIPTISYCRVLIKEDSNESLKIADEKITVLMEASKGHHNTVHAIELMTLKALISYKMDQLDEAKILIEEALSLARPSSIILPFIEPGRKIEELLLLVNDTSLSSFKQYLISFFNTTEEPLTIVKSAYKTKPAIPSNADPLKDKLSVRENEIYHLVAEGFRNKEIANQLFISTDTVKKHLYNIFQKMEVKNRIELVSKVSSTI